MRTVAIIQARMSSTRLPSKVLAEILGRPMLQHVVERVRRTTMLDNAVVATSIQGCDDPIANLCATLGIACYRGSEDDVLDRYYQAAVLYQADPVVRITADCPLIDPQVVDRVIEAFATGQFDYVSNIDPPTYPDGLDTEVCSFAALAAAWRDAKLRSEREHVTLYIRNHPELFRRRNLAHTHDISDLRWVVDEPRDLEFVRAVYGRLGSGPFAMDDVLRLIDQVPELTRLNTGITRNEGLMKSLQQDVVI